MNKCLIIGGGISGLTAASYLSSKQVKVTLLESSPKLGGRTYSFFDENTQTTLDNGQHILMGCYNETLALFNLVQARDNFLYQQNLRIEFLKEGSTNVSLDASKYIYPYNLLAALLRLRVFGKPDKFLLLKFLSVLPFVSKKRLEKQTVEEWLIASDQTENLIKNFWEIICIGALNANLNKASALMFYEVITQIFFRGNFASTIILPKYGLSESLIDPARNFIVQNGGEIILSSKVEELILKRNKVSSVVTREKGLSDFDFVISAIPVYALEKIIDLKYLSIQNQFEQSTILNIHLWIDKLDLKEKFYGFLDSPLHWIFVKDNHFNVVISDANYLANWEQDELLKMVINELNRFFPIDKNDVKTFKVIKEKRATFIPDNKTEKLRPKAETSIENLLLAGDWTDTGLPATIEAAVKSGRIAAEKVLEKL